MPVPTVAQNSYRSVELTPYAGYRFGGSFKNDSDPTTVALDDGESLGLILDVRESAHTEWEVLYARQATAADTSMLAGFARSTNLRIETLQGGGACPIQVDGRVLWQVETVAGIVLRF